jgi:hypothetical protein
MRVVVADFRKLLGGKIWRGCCFVGCSDIRFRWYSRFAWSLSRIRLRRSRSIVRCLLIFKSKCFRFFFRQDDDTRDPLIFTSSHVWFIYPFQVPMTVSYATKFLIQSSTGTNNVRGWWIDDLVLLRLVNIVSDCSELCTLHVNECESRVLATKSQTQG